MYLVGRGGGWWVVVRTVDGVLFFREGLLFQDGLLGGHAPAPEHQSLEVPQEYSIRTDVNNILR